MKMRRYCYIIAALVISITTTLAKPHIIRNIGAAEGLNDLLVNSIYEDADGFMWFGTGSTLELFDGLTLTHYPLPLSEQGEFNSRASFFRIFKKKVGMTPNEFVKKVKQ